MTTTAWARQAVKHRRPLAKAGVAVLTVACLAGWVGIHVVAGFVVGSTAFDPLKVAATTCAGAPDATAGVLRNVGTIAAVGASMGVTQPGQIIAVATTLVEAGGLNLASRAVPESVFYPNDGVAAGDHDSVGLFQQRASWGTVQQRMTPTYSATKFYERLLSFDWQSMDPGAAAQKVQVSAFPGRYATKMAEAATLLGAAPAVQPCATAETVLLDGKPGTYSLGAVKPHVQATADTLGPKFGIKVIGGVGARSGPSDHPAGLALDFMTNSAADGANAGHKLAAYLEVNAAALKLKYIIWYQRIWSPERAGDGWRQMENRGNATANHYDHVHVSFHE